jgi:hypothetical protein
MGLLSFLFGSTAEVELDGDRATKHYYESNSYSRRALEKENLEILHEHLGYGDVRVPALLNVEYDDDDDIVSLTTEQVYGYTRGELISDGLRRQADQALRMAEKAIQGSGVHLPDLATEGNIIIQLDDRNNVELVYIVDVGDIY